MEIAFKIPPELLDQVRTEARTEALRTVREELAKVALLAKAPAPPPPRLIYMRRASYAARVGFGLRKLDELIAAGLPTIGEGRTRRIDVEQADAWLAEHLK